MQFDQYHEPPEELSPELRTKARLFASLAEEAEAINWYEQRLSVEPDAEAAAIMANAQLEEFKHFVMDLEFLFRKMPVWREMGEGVLFKEGNIVDNGDAAEGHDDANGHDEAGNGSGRSAVPAGGGANGSLGIGSLKGAGL